VPERHLLGDIIDTIDWDDGDRETDRREQRTPLRRYTTRRHLMADIRNFLTIRPTASKYVDEEKMPLVMSLLAT